MELKPVKNYKLPYYPDKSEIFKEQLLLEKIPVRWQKNIKLAFLSVAFTSTVATAIFPGCSRSPVPKLAGDVMPVYVITEDEAKKIIDDEFEKYGVKFESTDKSEFNGAKVDLSKVPKYENYKSVPIDIKLDGYDEKKKIGYEFISNLDTSNFNNDVSLDKTNDEINLKTTAPATPTNLPRLSTKEISETYQNYFKTQKKDVKVGTFYEANGERSGKTEEDKVEAEKELRAQIQAFIDWLKSEGIV